MSEFPNSTILLQRVGWRLYAGRLAKRTFVWFIVAACVYAAVLLFTRLTGLIPDRLTPQTLWAIPGAAVLFGLLTTRFPNLRDSARQTDLQQSTKDLFLTLTMLEGSAGEYKPLVSQDAERRAAQIRADAVVPFDWQQPMLKGAVMPVMIGLLALAITFLPSLDPFGKQAIAKEQEIAAERLAQSRKEAEVRRAQLEQQKALDNENSEEVQQALEQLMSDFRKMRTNERIPNSQRLAVNQKDLGDKWRRLNTEQLQNLMNQGELDQRFGGAGAEQMRKWERELQQGSSESLEEMLNELSETLEQLARTDDPVERTEMMREVEKKLREMSDFATDKAGSQQLAASLQRALDQLETMQESNSEQLSAEAMEALQESLEISQMECKNLAQAARDLESLEEAMRLISMAKDLNGEEMLDGEQAGACQSLGDYKSLYEQMMAGMEPGQGTGGEGFGEGGEVPEDDSVDTDFVSERSKSQIEQGKVLLSMKTKGLSDTGEVRKEYRAVISDLKQGVAEAIDQEQIPPGYHDVIKGYFDSIETVEPALGGEEAEE